MTAPTPESIAARLSKAQRRALLAFPDDAPVEMANGYTAKVRSWRKASELGVSGSTLLSMQVLGGVNPRTFEPGPMLTTDDWSREGRHWSLTDLGLAVRTILERQTNDQA